MANDYSGFGNATQLTGNIGLFYSCYQLSLRGWSALPTIRNAKGADIIIFNGQRKLGIQVKTIAKKANVPLGKCELDDTVDFWIVLINMSDDEKRRLYIIPQDDIKRAKEACIGDNITGNLVIRNKSKKDDSNAYWMSYKFLSLRLPDYDEAWNSME